MSTVRSSSLVGNSAFSKFARIYFVRDLVETIYSYLFLSDRTADRTIIRRAIPDCFRLLLFLPATIFTFIDLH